MSVRPIAIFILLFFYWTLWGQQYQSVLLPPLKKQVTINAKTLESQDFLPVMSFREAPSPSGKGYRDYLERLKMENQRRYTRQEGLGASFRSSADQPLIIRDFNGNSFDGGIPLDNHLAVSNAGQIVSVINNNITVYNEIGQRQIRFSLRVFTESLNTLSNFQFDPRIFYDPEADRFVIAMISGFECATSEIILAFSESNDATANWHLYNLKGCPNDDASFADYPMMVLTAKDLFLSYNAVRENVSWQAGFIETIILQIDKNSGYAGEDLISVFTDKLNWEGQPIRNLCPIKGGSGLKGDNCYFLSNRNFDVQNDSFFLVEITSSTMDPARNLQIKTLKSNVGYGVPPNAQQKIGFLATNDARVLDGFLENDQIQFVMNCIDTIRNVPALFHGLIDNVATDTTIYGTLITDDLNSFGYPGIAYTGIESTDQDAIIIINHSSRIRNAGVSALYFDNEGQYSPITTVKEGSDYIQLIEENPERWGDYSGIQRRYDAPGRVWTAATYGVQGRRYATWIAQLGRPGTDLTAVEPINPVALQLKTYPNPAAGKLYLDIVFPEAEHFSIKLSDVNGRIIKQFFSEKLQKAGHWNFSFSTKPLEGGIYFIQVTAGNTFLLTKKIVVVSNR